MDESRTKVNVPFLEKWINILFWFVIISGIINLLANENITKIFPWMGVAGQIVSAAMSIFYAVIMLKMSSESYFYRRAAIFLFITSAINIITIPMSDELLSVPSIFVSIILIVIGILGEYYEMEGHSEILCDIDVVLSEKWTKLFKWYLGMFLGMICSILLAVIIPVLALLVMLFFSIAMLVVCILKIVYIYKTAKALRTYGDTIDLL